ncbi:MAG: methyl-accepting chemotaxis protein [Nitrospirae bacterium]|nr:methyl-accepting chemotaxis protein [Nitrospirota bacterium]
MTRGYRRRNYFIKKSFQSRFILRFLLVSSLWSILSIALFNFLAYKKIDAILFSMRLPAKNTGSIFFKEVLYANITALIFIILTFFLTARGIHNKIVRSLFRIRVDILRFARGDLASRIMLSQEDEFKDFAETLNSMAVDLHHRFSDLKGHLEHITESVGKLRISSEGDNRMHYEEILKQLDTMEEKIREFRK